MHLRVVTPKCEKINIEVDSVSLPGAFGEICILPGHTALISTLEVGILQYSGSKSGRLAVNRGFLEVMDDNITVLTETAEGPEEIDPKEQLRRSTVPMFAWGPWERTRTSMWPVRICPSKGIGSPLPCLLTNTPRCPVARAQQSSSPSQVVTIPEPLLQS